MECRCEGCLSTAACSLPSPLIPTLPALQAVVVLLHFKKCARGCQGGIELAGAMRVSEEPQLDKATLQPRGIAGSPVPARNTVTSATALRVDKLCSLKAWPRWNTQLPYEMHLPKQDLSHRAVCRRRRAAKIGRLLAGLAGPGGRQPSSRPSVEPSIDDESVHAVLTKKLPRQHALGARSAGHHHLAVRCALGRETSGHPLVQRAHIRACNARSSRIGGDRLPVGHGLHLLRRPHVQQQRTPVLHQSGSDVR